MATPSTSTVPSLAAPATEALPSRPVVRAGGGVAPTWTTSTRMLPLKVRAKCPDTTR